MTWLEFLNMAGLCLKETPVKGIRKSVTTCNHAFLTYELIITNSNQNLAVIDLVVEIKIKAS